MEIVNILPLGTAEGVQNYSDTDTTLINNTFITPTFGVIEDYIETYIRDLNGDIAGLNYFNTNYKPGQGVTATGGVYSAIQLDPVQDAKNQGIDRGTFTIKYNFFRLLLNSDAENQFWIREISPSRTEIKVARQDLSNTDLLNAFNDFNTRAGTLNYYPDFLLNFGLDVQLIAVNAVFVQENDQAFIIFKLYEPLPLEYGPKTQFWVVDKVAESVEYEVSIEIEEERVVLENALRGPNYKVAVNQKQSQTTPYYNHNSLLATSVSSSYQQLQSWLEDRAISINVDYSNFDNFIHFSSATERLLNFKYKVELIEQYKAEIAAGSRLSNTPGNIVVTSNNALQQNIDNIINKFDPYEYYLYFESASTAWPKATNLPPYELYSVTSSQVIDWLGNANTPPSSTGISILYSASLFDSLNKDNLEYSMPSYIREDEANEPYNVFLNMIGQHFDNIWLYYKDVSNRYVATNNPDTGISLDLVADALRGFGIELYTNSNISDNIYYSMFGLNDVGSTLPLTSSQYAQLNLASSSLTPLPGEDYLSASIYLPPFGSEKLNKYVTPFITPFTGVTASFDTIGPRELEKEIYKRIYHNLPYLLKTKGTQRGIKALIACYGIPNSILTINEFGANNIYTEPGIQQIQNQKIFTGSLTQLSSSVLTPTTTLQYFDNNIERGSIDIEVGFSPADSINSHITGTLGNFNIMQYIGDPALQYSSSYTPLTNLSNNYFSTHYNNRYNVWDFIRLIKFYNNSLFKSIKDYVPTRASVTSGIIIKSHILERNKYARHEPVITTHDYSESIDLLTLTGSDAPTIIASTAYTGSVMTLLGPVQINNSYHFEPYTGEFSGSAIKATTEFFAQTDTSNIFQPFTSSVQGVDRMFTTYSLNYLYNNVSGAVLSQRFLNLDYSSDPYFPVNYGLITKSLDLGRASIGDPYAQYAELQDYNYSLQRSIIPRYSGSKSTSLTYNKYTPKSPTYEGDKSYGLNPAIDYYSSKYAYIKDVYTASLALPRRSNLQIKYLLDNEGNVLDLTKENNNIVDIQNLYKSGLSGEIALFDYNQANLDIQFLANNKNMQVYEGGWIYLPILYKTEPTMQLEYAYQTPRISSSFTETPAPPQLVFPLFPQKPENFTITYDITEDDQRNRFQAAFIQHTPNIPLTQDVNFVFEVNYQQDDGTFTTIISDVFYPAQTLLDNPQIVGFPQFDPATTRVALLRQVNYEPRPPIITSVENYLTGALDAAPNWYAVDSRTIRLSATQSALYNEGIIQSTTASGIEPAVLPFSLSTGDMLKFYSPAGGWIEEEEYRVASIYFTNVAGVNYLQAVINRDLNPAVTMGGTIPATITRYIVNKHVPDETNLIVRYSPKTPVVEEGLIFPNNINPVVRANAGNIIRQLKASNLL